MRKITMLLAALLLLVIPTAAIAHPYAPGDGSHNYTQKAGTDGWGTQTGWPWNDGRIKFGMWYYDHGDHLHSDHLNVLLDKNFSGNDDYLSAVKNIRIRMFRGNCTTSFPRCANEGEVTKVFDQFYSTVINDETKRTFDLPHKFGTSKALVVFDYTAVGVDPVQGSSTYEGQEEFKLG